MLFSFAMPAPGREVVRLKGGDPFIFGRGGEEVEAARAAGIPVEVDTGHQRRQWRGGGGADRAHPP